MLYRFLKDLFKKREQGSGREDNGEVVKPFLDHLEDLRWTIIKMVLTLVIGMVVCFVFATEAFHFLQKPIEWAGIKTIIRNNSPFAAILAAIQLSFYGGIAVTLPFLTYFLGEFVLPALTKKEKRYIIPALAVGFLLFLGGIVFCFTQVLPGMLKFLSGYAAKSGFEDMWDVKTYYAFVAHLCIAFGLLCEVPVVVITLNFIGVVSYKGLASTRAYALTGILVLCAIVSPSPDLATLFMLAFPIMFLYEMCIWIVYYLDKRRAKRDNDDDEGAGSGRPYNDPNEPID